MLKPMGARVWVEDIITTLSIEARAEAAGLIAIVNEENRPQATQGKVIAVGSDPFMQELVKEGDVVFFKKTAGDRIYRNGLELRSLDWVEIIGVDDGK